MQTCGRANFSRVGARFGFLNAKMNNFPTFHLFLVLFVIFWVFWLILFAQIFLKEILVAQKNQLLESLGQCYLDNLDFMTIYRLCFIAVQTCSAPCALSVYLVARMFSKYPSRVLECLVSVGAFWK